MTMCGGASAAVTPAGSAPRGTRRTPHRTDGRSPARRTPRRSPAGPRVHSSRGPTRRASAASCAAPIMPVFSGVTRACRVTKRERDSSSSSSTRSTPPPRASGATYGSKTTTCAPKPASHAGDPAADRPVPDQPDGAVLQFGAHGVVAVVVAPPGAAREVHVRLRDAAGRGEHHRQRVLGGRRRVAARREGDGDAVRGRRLEVGVHRSAAADAEQSQVGRRVEDLLGERRELGDADLDAVQRLDHLLLGAGRLVDLGDPADRLVRPREVQLADLEAARTSGWTPRGAGRRRTGG